MSEAGEKRKKDRKKGGFSSLKNRASEFYSLYTAGLRPGDFKKLFTEETRGLYSHFGGSDGESVEKKDSTGGVMRSLQAIGRIFMGFVFAMSPARRIMYGITFLVFLLCAFIIITAPDQSAIRSDAATVSMYTFVVASFLLALELADKLRAKDELELARELQTSLLPAEDAHLPGLTIHRHAVTATEVGGDYHDLLFAHGLSCVAVGDVSGHGLASGVVMAMAKSAWNTQLQNTTRPGEVLRAVDAVVRQVGTKRTLMTFLHCQFDLDNNKLELANAGHIYPLLLRAGEQKAEWLETPPAFPLGVGTDVKHEVIECSLSPGDVIVLVSDGLIESLNEEGQCYDYHRLQEVAASNSGRKPEEISAAIVEDFESYIGEMPIDDDLTLLTIGYRHA